MIKFFKRKNYAWQVCADSENLNKNVAKFFTLYSPCTVPIYYFLLFSVSAHARNGLFTSHVCADPVLFSGTRRLTSVKTCLADVTGLLMELRVTRRTQ